MAKRLQINIRSNSYSESLVQAMAEKLDSDKSKVIHAAIEYYANYVLGQDEVMNIRLYQLYSPPPPSIDNKKEK